MIVKTAGREYRAPAAVIEGRFDLPHLIAFATQAMKFSARSSIHLTGRPSSIAAAGIASSSGWKRLWGRTRRRHRGDHPYLVLAEP